ncbi:MAG: right-handed parallel beta-helix repeat-containing protein, partial [Thermoplasmata archaeon]
NNARYGSCFVISHGNNISFNEALNNDYGIRIRLSNGNFIHKNNASENIEGISVYESSGIEIIDNSMSRNGMYGFHLSKSTGAHLVNNTMIDNGIRIMGNEIEYWNMHKIDISNTVNGKPVYFLKNQTGGVIPSNAGQVILANCSEIEVKDTELINCSIGILLGFSMRNNISNNNVSRNWVGLGIQLAHSDGNNVHDNNALYNGYGIGFSMSENNVFMGNNITNCNTGFFSWSTRNNVIMSNNISDCDYGLVLYFSLSNRIYHNNIINNIVQAQDDGLNYWDDGYPSGGNYWSDYTGIDNFKGPNQDQPGSDGIGDTEYLIDSNSIDHYPLMDPYIYKPLENYTILKQGWNLISIPLIQQDQNLSKVLEMIDGYYDAVQWYDVMNGADHWKHHEVEKSLGNDLFEINETMGFWIHITRPGDTIFLYNGTQPTKNQTINLHSGWNLVGYPSLTSYNRTNALNNIDFDSDVDAIWTHNPSTKKWKELTASDFFEIGKGYWIHAKVECEWEVPL